MYESVVLYKVLQYIYVTTLTSIHTDDGITDFWELHKFRFSNQRAFSRQTELYFRKMRVI